MNEMKQIELTKLEAWHDDGDDGISGWQPIVGTLIKR